MNIAIVSLNFSPGHYSHMDALYNLLKVCNHEPIMVLDNGYEKMIQESLKKSVLINPKKILLDKLVRFDYVFIQNPSVYNLKFVKLLTSRTKIAYIYHEPFDSFRRLLAEGIFKGVKATGAAILSRLLISKCDVIIVPSKYAEKLYRQHEYKVNNNLFVIPLLFTDEKKYEIRIDEKKCFSYIGTACSSHNFEMFLGFIRYCIDNNHAIRASIVTKTDISFLLKKYRLDNITEEKLFIRQGQFLSNADINEAYSKSYCVWNCYKVSTQSGVLPKAMMFGTPVIATDIGSFKEFIHNGINGYLVEKIDYEELLRLIRKLSNDLSYFSKNAVNTYIENFDYRSNVSKLESLMEK